MKKEGVSEAGIPGAIVMNIAEGSRKRPLSTDSSVPEPEEDPKYPKLEKVKRKKMAVLMAYSGSGYLGMQRNPGRKTIEEELLGAMKRGNLISEEAYEHPQEIQFQRAARTDKGVSAARQIVSLKLPSEGPVVESINENLPEQIRVIGMKRVTKGFNSKSACDARTYSYMLPTFAFEKNKVPEGPIAVSQDPKLPIDTTAIPNDNFRLHSDDLERVNEVLKLFEGTHNFHNFTSRKKPMDPSAQRYIISMKCDKPDVYENIEFATITVKGQSFMLHQIRKMVGLALAVLRGLTPAETIAKAWKTDRLDIPVAPSLGLVLEEVHYDKYNRKFGGDGMHDALDWTEFEEEILEFKKKYISSMIVKTEIEEKSKLKFWDPIYLFKVFYWVSFYLFWYPEMENISGLDWEIMFHWLQTLPFHTYDVREQNVNHVSDEDSGDKGEKTVTKSSVLEQKVTDRDDISNDESSSSSGNPSSTDSLSHGLRTLANAAEVVMINRTEVNKEKKDVHNGQ